MHLWGDQDASSNKPVPKDAALHREARVLDETAWEGLATRKRRLEVLSGGAAWRGAAWRGRPWRRLSGKGPLERNALERERARGAPA